MNIARFAAALVGLALLAAGCGQKGPLYMEVPPKPQATAPAKKKAKLVQPAPQPAPAQAPESAQPDATLPADTQPTQP